MADISNEDTPWFGVYHRVGFGLYQGWNRNALSVSFSGSPLPYRRIDVKKRAELRRKWNQPVIWPFVLLGVVLVGSTIPAIRAKRKREQEANPS